MEREICARAVEDALPELTPTNSMTRPSSAACAARSRAIKTILTAARRRDRLRAAAMSEPPKPTERETRARQPRAPDRPHRQRHRASPVARKKTVVVEVVRRFRDPVYGKYVKSRKQATTRTTRRNEYRTNDLVEIRESRPLSRTKRWVAVRLHRPPRGGLAMIQTGNQSSTSPTTAAPSRVQCIRVLGGTRRRYAGARRRHRRRRARKRCRTPR